MPRTYIKRGQGATKKQIGAVSAKIPDKLEVRLERAERRLDRAEEAISVLMRQREDAERGSEP